jgi:histone deacetylase 1/2
MSPAASLDTLSSPIISSPLSGLDSATQFSPPEDPDFHPENLCVILPLSHMNIHPMTTRSKNGISKRKAYSTTVQPVDFSPVEPSTFKIASKHVVWQSAMQEEINALHAQGTWDLVPLPHAKNLVGCKWVYRLKKNADGSIARRKARLVAKGFS